MNFTRDQAAAFDAYSEHFSQQEDLTDIDSDDAYRRMFLLSGPAGCGKTTLARHIARHLMPKLVLFTAPTHAAVAVLRGAGRHPVHASTIHSALGIRPRVIRDGSTVLIEQFEGHLRLGLRADCGDRIPYRALVLDEVSMVGRELRNWIDQKVPVNMPVLLLGDPYQLPPVNETESPFWQAIPKQNQYKLTEIVRQSADNPLIAASQSLVRQQDQIDAKTSPTRRVDLAWLDDLPAYAPEKHGVFDTTEDGMMACFLSEEFRQDPRTYRVLCYTNAQVHRYNRAIRLVVVGETESPFIVNERVINRSPLGLINPETEDLDVVAPLNSEMRVLQIEKTVIDLKLGGKTHRWGNRKEEIIPIRCWRVALGMVDDPGVIITKYIPVKHGRREALLDVCVAEKRWFDKMRVESVFPDLRNAYATTVHTAQGITINRAVFVDVDDISRPRRDHNLRLRLQLLYTAVTRPREALVIAPVLQDPNMTL